MTRSRIIVVLLFIVAFGAGLSVGKVLHRPPAPQDRGPSWLSHELNLTDQQREEMLAIWDNVYKTGSDERTSRRELSKQRSDAVANLISEDKKEELARINDQYNLQVKDLMAQGRDRYMKAVEATKTILTATQREKYEELLAKREEQRRSRGGSDRGGSGRGGPGRGGSDNHDGERSSRIDNSEPVMKSAQRKSQITTTQSTQDSTEASRKVVPKTNE